MKSKLCLKTSPEVVELKRVAEELARRQDEPLSTLHILTAVTLRNGPAADLLLDRRLTADTLLTATPCTDKNSDAVDCALSRAAEICSHWNETSTNALHVLLALINENHSAAHRVLVKNGVNLQHLRAAAMHVGLGLVGRRRVVTRNHSVALKAERKNEFGAAPKPKVPMGVTIPLFGAAPPRDLAKPAPISRCERRAQIIPILPTKEGKPIDGKVPESLPAVGNKLVSDVTRLSTRHKKRRAVNDLQLDNKQFPTLATFGIQLSAMAARGELDPVIGRDHEIERLLDVLAKRHGNNPVLVGAAGVGKTSVVRGLALRLAEHLAPGHLDDRIIIEISIPELLAGTGVRGALSQRVVALHQEVKRAAGRVVVFFDEIHQLFLADAAEELTGELKLALARGELPCIGATTPEGYQRTIDADPALARRFTTVEVEESSPDVTRGMLDSIAERLGQHHRVDYDAAALDDCVRWSVRYLPGRQLPDKAVSILDLAGARVRRRQGSSVTRQAVAEVVATLADMPVERLTETDAERFLKLEQLMGEKVVGHQSALEKIARILRRNAAGLGSKRPLGTFLLLGPTGVGKTETAKALASVLFHSETALTRVDMAEYSEAHSVARLLGAPPGYVGHDAGGQLTQAVARRPYQIVLLDEIEKAHPDVVQSFLSVFDEGRMTDGRGRTVDFTNTVILMTSNLGSEHTAARKQRRAGFGAEDAVPSQQQAENGVIAAAREHLSPELYNRIDELLVFAPLSRQEVRQVARRLLQRTAEALKERQIDLHLADDTLEWLLDHGGYDVTLGARPMKRTLARHVEAPLADQILRGALVSGMTAKFAVRDGALTIVPAVVKSLRSGSFHAAPAKNWGPAFRLSR